MVCFARQLFKSGRSPSNDALSVHAPLRFFLSLIVFYWFRFNVLFYSSSNFMKMSKLSTEKSLITFTLKQRHFKICVFFGISFTLEDD